MDIKRNTLKGSPKRIGRLNGMPVFSMTTKGGLNLIILTKSNGGSRILGAAPHIAVARFIAEQKEPELVIDELSKSENVELASYKHILPHWVGFTNKLIQTWDQE